MDNPIKTSPPVTETPKEQFEIQIYLDNGVIFKYSVSSAVKVREHISAIIQSGYRHNDGEIFEHYPPHRVLKVKSSNIPTLYRDTVSGT